MYIYLNYNHHIYLSDDSEKKKNLFKLSIVNKSIINTLQLYDKKPSKLNIKYDKTTSAISRQNESLSWTWIWRNLKWRVQPILEYLHIYTVDHCKSYDLSSNTWLLTVSCCEVSLKIGFSNTISTTRTVLYQKIRKSFETAIQHVLP